jgi:flagellar basal body-associated protein FliL
MKLKKIAIGVLVTLAILTMAASVFAFSGGGGHGGGGHSSGHSSGHAGGEGHGGEGAHEGVGGHSAAEETHVVPRTYFVGSGGHGTLQDLCPKGVASTEDKGASDVAVTCKDENPDSNGIVFILIVGFFGVIMAAVMATD